MRIVIDYNVCPPTSYGKGFMDELAQKVEALEQFAEEMIFTKQIYDKTNMLQSTEDFTLREFNAHVQAIEVDLDCAGDEMYLALDTEIETVEGGKGLRNLTDVIHVEVVTKEIAEENDKDFLRGEYNDLVESGYEVGDDNSYYKQIGDTNFYYREM